jgi:hypothetical protein
MIEILLLGGACFLVIIIAAIIYLAKRDKGSSGDSASGSAPNSLKGELSRVQGTVVGENADDVISSGYFAATYPGVRVAQAAQGTAVSSALPGAQPGFLLLLDGNKTITGVDATDVTWDDPSAQSVAPAKPRAGTKTSKQSKPKTKR